MSSPEPLLKVEKLAVHFPIRAGVLQRQIGAVRAVDGVSFAIGRGETLGLVGESGSGKSTTGLAIMGLIAPTSGEIWLDGRRARSADRRRLQIIFQDPYSSLNPRHRIGASIRAPLDVQNATPAKTRKDDVLHLMRRVGLRADQADHYPHQLSGGQRQRVGIARALALRPDIVICDEPVSALDVSVQAQILNLLADLQKEFALSFLMISHDLGVVGHVAHRVAVMYLGRIVEIGDKPDVFSTPLHPYTELLMRSEPSLDPRRRRGFAMTNDEPASASPTIEGCAFRSRCPIASDECRTVAPLLTPRSDSRQVACHRR